VAKSAGTGPARYRDHPAPSRRAETAGAGLL